MLTVAEPIGGRSFPLAAEAMIATFLAGRDEDLGSSLSPLYQQVIERAAAHLYQVFPRLGITSRAAFRDALDALDGPGSVG